MLGLIVQGKAQLNGLQHADTLGAHRHMLEAAVHLLGLAGGGGGQRPFIAEAAVGAQKAIGRTQRHGSVGAQRLIGARQ